MSEKLNQNLDLPLETEGSVSHNKMPKLALLAEFYSQKMNEDLAIQKYRKKDATEMVNATRIITDLASQYESIEEALIALDELEKGWVEEGSKIWQQEATEDEIDTALAAIRKARAFIEQNLNIELDSRKDFSVWLGDRAKKEKQSIKLPTMSEIDSLFNASNVKTAEEIKDLVTPAVKTACLEHILEAVDAKVEQGKRLFDRNPGSAVEARKLVTVLGNEALLRRYQFIASAGENRIINASSVGSMRIDEFLKKYLDYDLRADSKRKMELEKYTNLLDQ